MSLFNQRNVNCIQKLDLRAERWWKNGKEIESTWLNCFFIDSFCNKTKKMYSPAGCGLLSLCATLTACSRSAIFIVLPQRGQRLSFHFSHEASCRFHFHDTGCSCMDGSAHIQKWEINHYNDNNQPEEAERRKERQKGADIELSWMWCASREQTQTFITHRELWLRPTGIISFDA